MIILELQPISTPATTCEGGLIYGTQSQATGNYRVSRRTYTWQFIYNGNCVAKHRCTYTYLCINTHISTVCFTYTTAYKCLRTVGTSTVLQRMIRRISITLATKDHHFEKHFRSTLETNTAEPVAFRSMLRRMSFTDEGKTVMMDQ